jgi:membrane-associated protease RseP (regulator of RpoE activity)
MVPYVARERMSGPKHLWSGDWQRESAASTARSQRAPRVPDSEPPESSAPTPARPVRGLKGRRLRRTGIGVAAVILVLGGVAFGLSSLLGSSTKHHPSSSPLASATSTPTVPTVPPAITLPPQSTPPAQTTPPGQSTPPAQTTPPGQSTPPAQTTPPGQSSPSAQTPPPVTTTPITSPRMVNWLGMQIATQSPGAAVVQTVKIGSAADRAGINPGDVILAVNGRPIRAAGDIADALRGLPRGDRVVVQLAYGSGFSQAEVTLGAPPTETP